jgi:branched-chain amino acid transport system substrate-binding protein
VSQKNPEGRKFALLIGVSECSSGFKPLHCPANGVKALHDILINPEIGGFIPSQVTVLNNPSVSEMQASVAELFSGCSSHDLVLLYFTGHGITDEKGDFFFTTRETRKHENGSLNRGTTVPARFVRDEMSNCHSRRQIAILDCCFSGAFPDGVLAMDDQAVNVKQQLGGEGRAILTAATSTQYALEQEGQDLSVYTRYLVKGLETGEAAPSEHQLIRVGDLHNYIHSQLEIAAVAMSPQIYAARDGHEIVVATVLVDNELRYRKSVQSYMGSDGAISDIARLVLGRQAKDWNISEERATAIEWELEEPYRERRDNLAEYRFAFQAAVDACYPLSEKTREELRDYQRVLNLLDEDVTPIQAEIEERVVLQLPLNPPLPPIPLLSSHPSLPPNPPPALDPPQGFSMWQLFLQCKRKIRQSSRSAKFVTLIFLAVISLASVIIVNCIWAYLHPGFNFEELSSFGTISLLGNSENTGAEDYNEAINCFPKEPDDTLQQEAEKGRKRTEFVNAKKSGMDLMKSEENNSSITAFQSFGNALKICQNAPETLIFWNNAQIKAQNANAVTVAVIVPNKRPDDAIRMLRGFAQAQNEVNKFYSIVDKKYYKFDGISQTQNEAQMNNSIKLKLLIIKDDDTAITARAIAKGVAQQPDIKAALGHWTSSTSLAAAQVYEHEEMVFITPISIMADKTPELSSLKNYFFRTNASVSEGAQGLVDFMSNNLREYEPIIFYDSRNQYYSKSLKDMFVKGFQEKVDSTYTEINNSNSYDLAENLDAYSIIEKLKNQYLGNLNRVLVFFPSNMSAQDAIRIAEENLTLGTNEKPIFPLLGDMANLAIPETLKKGKAAVKGMVLMPSWSNEGESTEAAVQPTKDKFATVAKDLWQGEVDWTSAMSYNAAQAIIAAVDQLKPMDDPLKARRDIQSILRSGIEILGASGSFKFDNGRTNVKVQPTIICSSDKNKGSKAGFDFFRLPENTTSTNSEDLCKKVSPSQVRSTAIAPPESIPSIDRSPFPQS